jgi:hypothetical protein
VELQALEKPATPRTWCLPVLLKLSAADYRSTADLIIAFISHMVSAMFCAEIEMMTSDHGDNIALEGHRVIIGKFLVMYQLV